MKKRGEEADNDEYGAKLRHHWTLQLQLHRHRSRKTGARRVCCIEELSPTQSAEYVRDICFAASGAGPCLLAPRHQCHFKCFEAYSFHQQLVLNDNNEIPSLSQLRNKTVSIFLLLLVKSTDFLVYDCVYSLYILFSQEQEIGV